MADDTSKPAGPKVEGRTGRSVFEDLIAMAADEGAKARAPKEPADLIEENRESLHAREGGLMADDTSKPAPKAAGRTGRSVSSAQIARAANKGAKARAPKEPADVIKENHKSLHARESGPMAGDTSKPAPKVAGRTRRSVSSARNARAANKGAKARIPKEPAGSQELIEENRKILDAFVRANTAVLDGMAALSTEMLSFGNKRLSANVERSQTLAGCQDMEQAFKVQAEFFQTTVSQYLDQAIQLMAIMTTINRNLWTPLQAERTEAMREVDSH